MDMSRAILDVITLAVIAYMTWRGLQTYGRRMEDENQDKPEAEELKEHNPPMIQADTPRELQEPSSRVQAAHDETRVSGKNLPDQFYCVNTYYGPVMWLYNQPYAEQHFIEMHPYTEC